jgi:integrase
MALTATAIRNAKPKAKIYKLADSGGLYLLVRPTGGMTWKYDYRLLGRRATYTIGSYPEYSLSEARVAHLEARKFVAEGQNPTAKKTAAVAKSALNQRRFSDYAKDWMQKQNYAASTRKDLVQRLEQNLYPALDKRPVDQFSTRDLLDVLTPVANRGSRETAKRLAGIMRHIFNELVILGVIDNNPAQGIAELLPTPDHRKKTNFAHVTEKGDLQNLLQQIYKPSPRQSPVTTFALKLMPLLFLRPYNIRFMRWEYIDFDSGLLTIPGEEMKGAKELQVPLASQALEILRAVQAQTGQYPYVFVTRHGHGKPMSENTTTAAIKRLINPATKKTYGTGFMTSHGFRHTASTFLNEMGYSPDAIELQLAHESKDRVRATYNKAKLMEERTRMMQEWADYLEELRGCG